jgi:hypothetical protein
LIAWAENSIETLSDEAPALSPFIQAFARPINVESMPANLSPTYIGFDVPQLTEDILEVPEKIRFVRGTGDAAVAVDKNDTDITLLALDQNFVVRKARSELVIVDPRKNTVGNIRIDKSRLSLRKLSIPEIDDIYIGSGSF